MTEGMASPGWPARPGRGLASPAVETLPVTAADDAPPTEGASSSAAPVPGGRRSDRSRALAVPALVGLAVTLWAAIAIPARATVGARTTADEPQYLLSA